MTDRKETLGFDDLVQLVSFSISNEVFGVDILKVQEIIRMVEITKVPQAPFDCEGVINLRGKVIPILDLRKKFSMEDKEYDRDTRIVVCDIDDNVIGMIVDSVSEVLRIPGSTIEPPPEMMISGNAEYITGVAKLEEQLLLFLDISKMAGEVDFETSVLTV